MEKRSFIREETPSSLAAKALARTLGKPVAGAQPDDVRRDALGRPLEYEPHLPRKSSNTVLPKGDFQWNGRDARAGGQAMTRRVQQMQARGLRHCDIGEHWVPIAETRILGAKVSCFACIPETVADVESRQAAENSFEVREVDE